MKNSFVPSLAIVLLACSSLAAQPEDFDKKLQALEKSLSAEQKSQLDDYVKLNIDQAARYFDPASPQPIRTKAEMRMDILDMIGKVPANAATAFWRDLPRTTRTGFRRLDPSYVSPEERKAAQALPAAAKEEVAMLLSDQLDKALAARRKIIAYGPACRALVADQLTGLAKDSAKRLRHEDVLAKLSFEEDHERCVHITETVLRKASLLEKGRAKGASKIEVLVARGICDGGGRDRTYSEFYFYNFLHQNHDYTAGVGLGYGNGSGNALYVSFFGGQDNRLKSLGAVKYADVRQAPGPATTAKWWKNDPNAPVTAVVGHVYLLHVLDPNAKIDFAVKFRILDLSPDEWVIFEWERVFQEK